VAAYLFTSTVLWLAGVALIAWRSPGLIRERTRPGPGALESMPEELVLYGAPAAAHWLLAAIDPLSGRRWRAMPGALQALGLLAYAGATLVVIWAEVVNPFFSSAIRLQPDRGQGVITTGPYAFVRHPGYAAGSGLLVASAFALGSWLSLAPALLFAATIARRAAVEDAFLQANLAGYRGYAERVRFRLLPGIW
jgi:protein-S-isoprenylcysteine O-methyltransferase Ste14